MTTQRLKRVQVFRDGYASDNKGEFDVPRDTDQAAIESEARTRFGSFARVYREFNLPAYDSYGLYLAEDAEAVAVYQLDGRWLESERAMIDCYAETISDAGRHWRTCEFTRETLSSINTELRELYRQAAREVYRTMPSPFDTSKDNS